MTSAPSAQDPLFEGGPAGRSGVAGPNARRDLADVDWRLMQGADPTIPDSRHESSALVWAEGFGHADVVALLGHPQPDSR